MTTTKRNKQYGWKSTNQNLQIDVTFCTRWRKPVFSKRFVRLSDRGENVNVSCNFDLRWNFIAKHGNGREEIACRWKQKTACQTKQICLVGVVCKVSNRKTSSGEIFCFLGKRLLSIFKLCASSNFLFYNELLVGPQPPFLESGPGYSSRTVRKCSLSILLW